jgi:hypothetical protein
MNRRKVHMTLCKFVARPSTLALAGRAEMEKR